MADAKIQSVGDRFATYAPPLLPPLVMALPWLSRSVLGKQQAARAAMHAATLPDLRSHLFKVKSGV